MLLSAIVAISMFASPQQLSIEKSKVTPREVVAFNGVVVSIEKESVSNLDIDRTVVVKDFPLGMDGEVNLRLQQFDVFTPDAEIVLGSLNYLGEAVHREKSKPDVVLLRGAIEGDPSSRVFLALGEHTTNGLIETDGNTYVLAKNKSAGWTVVYNVNDVNPEDMNWKDVYCEALETGRAITEKRRYSTNVPEGGCQALQIAVETDWEFTELFDGSIDASSEYAATLFGAVSTIFESDLNVQTQISFLRIWNDDSDPWDQNFPLEQLSQFRTYWETNMDYGDWHLAHMLSGRNLGGGIAWINGVCTSYGYALSSNLRGSFPLPLIDNNYNNWDIYVVAHELGHNCGSRHTHDYEPPIDNCDTDCSVGTFDGTIMSNCHLCPGGMSNIVLNFHETVQDTIRNYLSNSISCSLDCEVIELMGACCYDQSCKEVTEDDCLTSGGIYFGEGTTCLNNNCVLIKGACCVVESWACQDDLTLSECNGLGGDFFGDASSCDLGWCDPNLPIACCLDEECNDVLQEECNDAGGHVAGLGVFCSDYTCYLVVDNDLCEFSRDVSVGLWDFTTIGATSGGEPYDSSYCINEYLGDMVNDVWFRYKSCADENVVISLCDSADFDTDLVIYELNTDSNDCEDLLGKQIECNGDDDGCGGYTSRVSFQALENTIYLIRVGGYFDGIYGQGDGQLLISAEECQQDIPCEGDLNLDGVVGVEDLLAIIKYWLSDNPDDLIIYDVDGDGEIHIGDILFIIAHWGCEMV